MEKKDLLPRFIYEFLLEVRGNHQCKKFKGLINKNEALRNSHSGDECYIIGSGPSLNKHDLKKLKNKTVITLNNFFNHVDFNEIVSSGKANYHMIAPTHNPQEESEWLNWLYEMELKIPTSVMLIFGLNNYKYNLKYLVEKYKLFKGHEIIWYSASLPFKNKNNHIDITKNIFRGETVSVYALVVAIFMGFKKSYLLGMDHDYFLHDDESKMRVYKSASHQNDELKRTYGNDFYTQELLRQYMIFRKYEFLRDNSKTEILNATEGGILRVFPLVSFSKSLL